MDLDAKRWVNVVVRVRRSSLMDSIFLEKKGLS